VIVLDASVLIAHLDEHDALHARAADVLIQAADQAFGCSPITVAEVLAGPAGRGRLDAAGAALTELEVAQIPLGEDAPIRLATLRAETGLKLPDCCVLLAAETAKASTVLTFDLALGRTAERLGLGSAQT
jgi:predicted nucleic acid-binding protein